MTRDERIEGIRSIERARGSTVVAYVAADRQGLEINIAPDTFPLLHRHLTEIGYQNQIDLFLYGTRGFPMAGYALAAMFREFCGRFNVIIPFKAYSPATLVALGADEIVMTELSQLSPIDCSLQHVLGPKVQLPNQPVQDVPVNVEDVDGFLSFATDELRLDDEASMQKVLDALSSNVNPLVLGAMHRTREEIAFCAAQLLKTHIDDEERVNNIVRTLMRRRFSHEYVISRKEAQDTMGLNVVKPDRRLNALIMDLWGQYADVTEMHKPYNPELVLEHDVVKIGTFYRGIIESKAMTHVFRTQREIERLELSMPQEPMGGPVPPGLLPGPPPGIFPQIAYREQTLDEGWIEDNHV